MHTAEFVSPKHPDKMCDQISDAILDDALRQDVNSRVAIEVMGGHGIITVTGEMTTNGFVEIRKIVTDFMGKDIGVQVNVVQQSREISRGVDTGGAGDQGIMRGYATNETTSLMPLEYELARDLCKYIYNKYPFDGKTQITTNGTIIVAIVASFQNVPKEELEYLISLWMGDKMVSTGVKIYCNPAGDWNIGGFDADTGLTGRKLLIDNYGPRYPVGGGSFSGKDATKVDRSAAYMARKIAVDLLKDDAEEVSVELAYAIGVEQPVDATAVLTLNGEKVSVDISDKYDLTPRGIIKALNLTRPIYQKTAEWGHFGNGFTWDIGK